MLFAPGVDQFYAAMLEIAHVSSGKRGMARTRDGCDHAIRLQNRAANSFSSRDELREIARATLVEGEDTSFKILEKGFSSTHQTFAPLPFRQPLHAIKEFGHGHRCDIQIRPVLCGEPLQDTG